MDTQQGNGLTLEALAQRLEALERENERMRSENAELRHEVSTLKTSGARRDEVAKIRGSETHQDGDGALAFEGRVSRRSLLSKAGAAAVAALAAGTLINPRQATAGHTNDDLFVGFIDTHVLHAQPDTDMITSAIRAIHNTHATGLPTIEALNKGSGAALRGESRGFGTAIVGKGGRTGVKGIGGSEAGTVGVEGTGGVGVEGTGVRIGVDGFGTDAGVRGSTSATAGPGVKGAGGIGVLGVGSDAQQAGVKGEGTTGVWGVTTTRDFAGVYGEHKGTKGIGTVGIGKGGDAGVLGRNLDTDGIGVQGTANTTAGKAGVKGEGSTGVWGLTSRESFAGVYGEHTGTRGIGTVGIGKGDDTGVLGRNPTGQGLRGEGRYGVVAVGGATGYGGRFEGGKAQLMLKPGGSLGKPTTGTHSKGEIYMDSAGTLFVCVASSTATAAAKWKKLSATTV